jgi:hypothetical protein
MAKYCLELPYGGIRHFPAGTYNEQMDSWTGRKELDMMSLVHSVWYMFKKLKMGEWKENELRLAKWMMPAEKEPDPPTHRLDDLIGSLWKGSWWGYQVLKHMRNQDA